MRRSLYHGYVYLQIFGVGNWAFQFKLWKFSASASYWIRHKFVSSLNGKTIFERNLAK